MNSQVYAIPGTDSWIISSNLDNGLEQENYVEMTGTPPILSDEEKLSGKIYLANNLGEWILTDDPEYNKKLIRRIKQVFEISTVNDKIIQILTLKLSELVK